MRVEIATIGAHGPAATQILAAENPVRLAENTASRISRPEQLRAIAGKGPHPAKKIDVLDKNGVSSCFKEHG
jgi:hypothetical protein